MSTKFLNKEMILQAKDLKTTEVDVPQWGGSILMREMTGKERDEFESIIVKSKNKDGSVDIRNLKAILLSMVLVDEEGKPLFNRDEIEQLQGKSATAINKLFEVAQEMNGIGEAGKDRTEGNSGSDLNDKRGSGSQDS